MTLPVPAVKGNDKESATFEEAIASVGSGYFQIKVAIIGGIVILSSYFAVGVMTFVLPAAHCDLHLNYHDRGNLVSIAFVGLIVTCHMWGFLSDTLGRRYILIRCLFFDALLYFITVLTPNFYMLFFFRFLNGVASCGGVVSIYAYIGEFQIDKYRSRALMISSFIAASAYIFCPMLAWIIIPGKWQFDLYPGLTFKSWRLFYVACGFPSLLSSVLLYFLPESPKFLLAKGKYEKVIAVLERMYHENHKKGDKFVFKHLKVNEGERVARLDDNKNKFCAVFHLLWNQTGPLLKKPYRFNFTLLCMALFACYFCNNGMYVWLPEAIDRMKTYRNITGKDVGTFCEVVGCDNDYKTNETTLKKMLGYSDMRINNENLKNIEVCNEEIDTSVYLVYILYGVVTLVVWVVITATIKYINKKYVMLFLTICNLFATSSMKWSNALILMPIKACSIMVFIAGVFPILNSVVVDIFPTNLRAMASCLTLMASRLGTVFTHEVTGFLIESHCKILMWNYIIFSAVLLLCICLLPSKLPKISSPSSTSNDDDQESRHNEEVAYL